MPFETMANGSRPSLLVWRFFRQYCWYCASLMRRIRRSRRSRSRALGARTMANTCVPSLQKLCAPRKILRSSASETDSAGLRGFTITAMLVSRARSGSGREVAARTPAISVRARIALGKRRVPQEVSGPAGVRPAGPVFFAPLFPVLVAKLGLFAYQLNLLALDEDVLHVSPYIKRIAVGDNHVAQLAHLERAQILIYAPDLRGVDGERLESLLRRQAESHGIAGGVWLVAGLVGVIGSKRDFHAAFGKLGRDAVHDIIAFRLLRLFVDRADNYRQAGGGNPVQQRRRVGHVVKNDLEVEVAGQVQRGEQIVGL